MPASSRPRLTAISVAAAIAVAGALPTLLVRTPVSAATTTSTVAVAADTYTSRQSGERTTNFGAEQTFSVTNRKREVSYGYLKFQVPAPADGSEYVGTLLRAHPAAPTSGSRVHVYTTGNGWSEMSLTWDNQPDRASRLESSGGYSAGSWVVWDLSAAVPATGGTLSLRLESRERAQQVFDAAESGAGPELVLTSEPLVTPTPSASPSTDPSVSISPSPSTSPTTEPSSPGPSSPPPSTGTTAAETFGWGASVAGDEFDYTGAPDPSKWNLYDSAGHNANGVRSPAAWSVDGSVVRVSGDSAGTTGGMSAQFDTRTYGRWESRMRTSARDSEYHPVLLLWPDSGNWPCDGEIDYAEGTSDVTKMHFYHHYSCSNSQTSATATVAATQWHNYAVEWTSAGVIGYLDGVEWFRDTNPDHQPRGSMHQTVQLDWFPDGTATSPSWMEVDWVRVYNPSGGSGGGGGGSNTVTVQPTEDAYTNSGASSTNYGASPDLLVDASPVEVSYLKFDLSAYSGQSVDSATLHLHVTDNRSGGTQTVRSVADNSWSENTITASHRPAVGSALATFGPTSLDSDVDVTLPPSAVGPGEVTLAIDSASSDGLHLGSSESATPPTLEVTLAGPDTTAPETTITSGSAATTSSTNATFAFTSSEPATFECQLDGGSFTACSSSKQYTGLALGSHTFAVRATDTAGNVETAPATWSWNIVTAPPDTTAPQTTITSGSAATTSSTNATFAFTSSEPATFECQLDGASFTACTSPKQYTGLALGSHTFAVRATDTAGNVDPSPATRDWEVLSPTPPPPSTGTTAAETFGWGASVAGDEFDYTGAPDPSKWNLYDSAGHNANGVRSPAAWSVDGSVVRVSGDSAGTTGGMSAQFDTRTYGRWESRMRTSARDSEYHPVLLLWPDSGNWPCDGEIDYAEGTSDVTKMHFYHHYSCSNSQTSATATVAATQWHNYAVEWTSAGVIGYLDGVEWFRDTNPDHQPRGSMHQTVQLDWFPDGTATSPSWMEVDWVRVYNPSGGSGGGGGGSNTVTVQPTEDAYTNSGASSTNYGASPDLLVDASPVEVSYLKFDLSAYSGQSVDSATLHLHVTDNRSGGTQTVRSVADNSWSENTITASHRPAVGSALATFGPTSLDSDVDVTLPPSAVGPGEVTLAIDSASSDGLHLGSSESATPPTLEVTLAGPDTTAPETTITSGSAATTSSTNATFAFTSSEPATFECQLDGGSFTACSSSKQYTGLALGSHTFAVRATDTAGNVETAPATWSWNIVTAPPDTTAPQTTITSGSAATTSSTNATFAFTSSEPATFECQLDGASFTACTSPKQYTGLALGSHTFAVRATDTAGNVETAPATWSWKIVTAPPPSADITIAAVGDLNPDGQSSTTGAAGLNAASIQAAGVQAVTVLGDFQYSYGDCGSLVNEFDRTGWGALMSKVIGTAGATHDWSSASDVANYRSHLAGACSGQSSGRSLSSSATGVDVGPDTSHWVDLGSWRVFSLSSALWRYDSAKANAATSWLDSALASAVAAGDHPLVIWHEPYWTSTSSGHGPTTAVKPWINVLDKYDVPLVLSGHQHGYERFYPQDADGTRDNTAGTQQFVVGTGGIGFYSWSNSAPNLATHQANAYGWLKLVLHTDGSYNWQFVRTSGGSFTDSGSRTAP